MSLSNASLFCKAIMEDTYKDRGARKRLIQELLVFIWLNGKAQSQQGYNDDLVMSFAILLWLRDTALKLRQQGIDLNKRALSQFQKTSPVIYTGNNNGQNNGWNWDTGYGDESLTWLIK